MIRGTISSVHTHTWYYNVIPLIGPHIVRCRKLRHENKISFGPNEINRIDAERSIVLRADTRYENEFSELSEKYIPSNCIVCIHGEPVRCVFSVYSVGTMIAEQTRN